LKAPQSGKATRRVRKQAQRDLKRGKSASHRPVSKVRSRATANALKREGHSAASTERLSQQGHRAAQKRGKRSRQNSARRAVKTKGPAGLRAAGRKAARTRASHRSA
jgi:hypothetical protein